MVLDVIDQSDAVGVVGMNLAVFNRQRIGGLGQLRPVALRVRGLKRLELERHRDIAAPRAALHPLCQRGGKTVKRRQARLIGHHLAREFGKTGMNLRRLAVGNRVAEHKIVIHLTCPAGSLKGC